jgi:superfamily II DNA or RNA helicase
MSTVPVSSPQDSQPNDPRYGQLFKVLADLLFNFYDFFSAKRSEKGFELSEQGRVSEVVIVRCSPEELILSGAVRDKRTMTATISISVVGNLAGFEICTLCDCRTNRYCEHGAAILESFFDEAWSDKVNEFIAHSCHTIVVPNQSTKELANISGIVIPGSDGLPLSKEMQQRLIRLSYSEMPLSPHKMAPRYQVGYELHLIDSNSKGQLRKWMIKAVVIDSAGGQLVVSQYDRDNFEEIASAGGVSFAPHDGALLLGLDALAVRKLERYSSYHSFSSLRTSARGDLLLQAVELGRCFIPMRRAPLKLGGQLAVRLGWNVTANGYRKPEIIGVPEGTVILNAQPTPMYINSATGEVGPVFVDGTSVQVEDWVSLPRVKIEQSPSLLRSLRSNGLPTAGLEDIVLAGEALDPTTPRVKLTVFSTDFVSPYSSDTDWSPPISEETELLRVGDVAAKVYAIKLSFFYADTEVTRADTAIAFADSRAPGGRILRNMNFERAAAGKLLGLGVKDFHTLFSGEISSLKSKGLYGVPSYYFDHLSTQLQYVPKLVQCANENGWDIELAPELMPNSIQASDFSGELLEHEETGWFEAKLRVESKGVSFDLGEVLLSLLNARTGKLALLERSRASNVVVMLRDRSIEIERERLLQLVRVVGELADPEEKQRLRFNRFSGYALENVLGDSLGRWQSSKQIQALRERIKRLEQPTSIAEPSGFKGSLRDYQQHGLAWLATLGKVELGGILADDMGLGKTVQIIAFLLLEQLQGRTGPNLVVCPKSVVPNWIAELSRFAPGLTVHQSTGTNRTKSVETLQSANVVVTSYALLNKDSEVLRNIEFNLAIFDEAQAIKNPVTVSYQAASALKARLKLPVSGTPLENNLQDLWAHFNLTMPGFLYSHRTFNKVYRKPIEKDGDSRLREHLAARIKPFVLRRTKQEVVKELPPLTEIIKRCELEGAQRDLYETIRQLTTKKVREALGSKGAKRSHIEFLDALLKLRQVCCDPRLVKTQAAQAVQQSAKLTLLMELLTQLLSEGRSVVLFSQFTSMLALIEKAVQAEGITYCILTGETTDRESQIKSFQAGEKRLFLMSLKAGGVGINLTAADTVVMYDPWWNPAVEAQAICRAHRIGQKNPVFAYRLIAQGSIEEKILDLQTRKRDLVENILSDNERPPELSTELVDYLFAPLGEGDIYAS